MFNRVKNSTWRRRTACGFGNQCGLLIEDVRLRIIEQRLGDPHSFLHAAGVAAQGPFAHIREIYQWQKTKYCAHPVGIPMSLCLQSRV